MTLPVNIDSTYSDDVDDASVAAHQQHHDELHTQFNDLEGYVGSGRILGFTEVAYSSAYQTTSTTPIDVPGLVTTVDVGVRPIQIRVEMEMQAGSANATAVTVRLMEESTEIKKWIVSFGALFEFTQLSKTVILNPASGEHTYKVTVRTNNESNGIGFAATSPQLIMVSEG